MSGEPKVIVAGSIVEELLQWVGGQLSQKGKDDISERVGRAELALTVLNCLTALGKVLTDGGDITAEYECRLVVTACEALRFHSLGQPVLVCATGHGPQKKLGKKLGKKVPMTEGQAGAQRIQKLIREMGGDIWPIWTAEEYAEQARQGTLLFPCIIAEEKASNTGKNAELTGALYQVVRQAMADARGISPESIPANLLIGTSPYHYERMVTREQMLSEIAEFTIWKRLLPGVHLSRLPVPYPPLESDDVGTRWRARLYIAAHEYPDALIANLHGIANDTVQRLSVPALMHAIEGIEHFQRLYDELDPFDDKKIAEYGKRVGDVHDRLAHELKLLRALLQEILTEARTVIEGGEPTSSIEEQQWRAWANRLSDSINHPIRFAADPDRR